MLSETIGVSIDSRYPSRGNECVSRYVVSDNADFASDVERAQHRTSGEEGDNFVHVQKMPVLPVLGMILRVTSISDALERSMKL
jgi:hypothetical protein